MGAAPLTTINQLRDIVEDEVTKEFNVSRFVIRGRARSDHFVVPRHVLWFLLVDLLSMSQPGVAWLVGKKEHTVIGYGVRAIRNRVQWDHVMRLRIQGVRLRCEKRIKKKLARYVKHLSEEVWGK